MRRRSAEEDGWRGWVPEGVAALVVLAVGLVETDLWTEDAYSSRGKLVLALGTALAVGLSRRVPSAALAVVWMLGLFQVATGVQLMLVQTAVTAVFFGTARWGRPATVVLGGLSIPLAVMIAFSLQQNGFLIANIIDRSPLVGMYHQNGTVRLMLVLAGLLLYAGTWPAGLALRFLARASASRASMLVAEESAAGAWRETEQAREIARLRDEQARLARDVHDVVGHSLAVILAQAESGQYLDDTGKLKKTMDTIATSARSSLRDVRQVLSAAPQAPNQPGGAVELDSLIDGVRRSGHEIIDTELGTRRPLPPEIEKVAYRVLQEMLTNAIRHGRRDQPILVERHWPAGEPSGGFADTLRIEVSNIAQPPPTGGPDDQTLLLIGAQPTGHGLDGMRRRLESVGGHFDVRRREQAGGTTFTVTAWLPVRAGAR